MREAVVAFALRPSLFVLCIFLHQCRIWELFRWHFVAGWFIGKLKPCRHQSFSEHQVPSHAQVNSYYKRGVSCFCLRRLRPGTSLDHSSHAAAVSDGPLGRHGPARHGRHQPAAGGAGRARRPARRAATPSTPPSPPTPRSASWSRCRAASAATCSPSSGTPRRKKLYGLNASGRSPVQGDARATSPQQGLKEIPEHGPLSWSVPGCVDGWDELHKQVRQAAARRPARRRRSTTPRRASRSPRSSPATGQAARRSWRKSPDAAATFLPGRQGAAGRATCSRTRTWPAVYRAIAKRRAATPSTRARSPRRSSPSRTRTAACSR